ncbi:hypothetical protein DPMN_169900 [Dreissena polymorpha]|uniref:SCP domain-containing protein n=1 Tax=Dreissena polymorpha TaxID=45954 RepID=A0A9D4IB21_DREPO|nr:hypothetical protein DPMN_169900 [Dreissena polymorpha]
MKQDILDVHNSLRRNFAKGSEGAHAANMKALLWDDDLARQARIRLRLSCKFSNIPFFEISDNDNCSNIARVSNGNVTRDILTWYSEIKNNFYANEKPNGFCHPVENCSQATVVLNADFRYIGCSYKRRCTRTTGSFYCIYKNDIDEPPVEPLGTVGQFYTTGPPCTHCKHSTSFCDDGLCNCRKTCSSPHGHGILDRRTCSCMCHYGYGPNCDVPCENPSRHDFVDYDICEANENDITPEECNVDALLRLSCPKTCGLCRSPIFL